MARASMKRHAHTHAGDLYGDVLKIKQALLGAKQHMGELVGEKVTDSFDEMRDRASTAQETVTDYVAERPFKSLGIAMLTGLIVGYFIHK